MGLIRIIVFVLIILFLAVHLGFGQNTATKIHTKGVEYAAQGNLNEAKEEFERALKIDPYYGPAEIALKVIEDVTNQKIKSKTVIHLFKGFAYGIKERGEESIVEFNKAIKLNPRYAESYNNRGFAYLGKGQYDKAISDFNKAIEINPLTMVYTNRGLAYFYKSQYDKACSDWKRACELGSCYDYELAKRKGECK